MKFTPTTTMLALKSMVDQHAQDLVVARQVVYSPMTELDQVIQLAVICGDTTPFYGAPYGQVLSSVSRIASIKEELRGKPIDYAKSNSGGPPKVVVLGADAISVPKGHTFIDFEQYLDLQLSYWQNKYMAKCKAAVAKYGHNALCSFRNHPLYNEELL